MKGLRSKEVKKYILKEVNAKDALIDMDVIEQAINVQASMQAFDNFGNNPASSPSCNKMQDSNSNSNSNSSDRGKGRKEKGKEKEKERKDNKDDKKIPEFVDFKKLSGEEKIKAMTKRGYCNFCIADYIERPEE